MDARLRELLRQYLQTEDPSILSNLITAFNRGGPGAIVEILPHLCDTDLPKIESILIQLFGPGELRRGGTPHQCYVLYQKYLEVYQQKTLHWEIGFGITYTRSLGRQEDRGFLLAMPRIIIYPGAAMGLPEGNTPAVSLAYQAISDKFPDYSVGISQQYALRYEALNGCHQCGRFPKAMGSDYCYIHEFM